MNRVDASVPVVVLGFHYGGLGIARSLGRLGVQVYAVDRDPCAAGFASRYCREAHVWDVDRAAPEDTLTFLDVLGERLGRAVLIPTSDRGAVLVERHATDLAGRYLFQRPRTGLVRGLTDKREVHRLATEFGVPTPAVLFPRSRSDVERFAAQLPFPVVLKGIDPTLLERRTGQRVAVVSDPDELLRCYDAWEDPAAPNLMLQEYVPGGDDCVWMFNGYFDGRSACLAAFTGRKLRQHPARAGATSLGICERNETVERLTVDFMRALGYCGVLDIGYRYDSRDGLYKLLDPNPRVGATFRLFVDDRGLDVTRCLYLDLTGQPVPRGKLRERRKWIVEDRDLESSLEAARGGGLTLGRWLASLAGIEEGAWFARDDLGPFLHMVRRLGARAFHGVAGRLRDVWGRVIHRRIKSLLGAAAFRTGLYRLLLRRKAAIVVFHRVGTRSEDGLPGCTTQEFRAYCDFFAEYFRVISLGELLDRLGRGEDVSRCLVITFDDGYRDNYDVAAIELAHRGLPACFFVVTGLVGSRTAPPWSTAGRTELEWLSWEQLGLLAARGFEIGSHTVHHVDLGRLTAADALREITDSKRRLEQALRTPVRYFSYPYGGRDQMPDAYRTLLRPVGFACCLSAYGGVVTPGTDPLHLPRIPVSPWYLTPGQFGFELLELAFAAPPGSRRRVPIPKSLAPA